LHGTSRTRCEQLAGIGVAVIDAVEHHVLEGDEVARRLLQVAAAGRHQVGQRILAVDRHQLVAQAVGRRMQRNGERHRAGVAQPVDGRHDAGSRHRDATPRQAVGVVVEHQAQCRHHVVEIGQRLAHAHQHHVADDALSA
jgi:hypothetical protein